MEDIIPRDVLCSNKKMWDKMEELKAVIFATKTMKKIVKKQTIEYQVPKFKTDKEVVDRIVRSAEYYKDLYLNEQIEKDRIEENLVIIPNSLQFRDYQTQIIYDGAKILSEHGFLYLAMEVRTGKTLTSLGIASKTCIDNVLFLTKKKAMSSIEADYKMISPIYDLTIINYESLHKLPDTKWDLIICDEAHSMGAFPKPSKRAAQVKALLKKCKSKVILLSGTPSPESYSQIYHQVYGIPNNPFNHYANFYKFCANYVDVKQKKVNGMFINDYTHGRDTIIDAMKPYTINYTQKEAGFKVDTREHIIEVDMKESTYKLIKRLQKDLVIEGVANDIIADTPVKLMSKLHQMYSGTVKFESGDSMVLDTSKAQFIYDNFAGQRIGIFYKFKEELNALKSVYGDQLTTDLEEFDATSKSIALQIVSGREGISLQNADSLVFYNIDFSATSYWQARDRMTTKDRLESDVYWIFAKGGIEHDIYKAVSKKKDYTLNHFKKLIKDE
jgi:SNF2 family DNA or RNA helicase